MLTLIGGDHVVRTMPRVKKPHPDTVLDGIDRLGAEVLSFDKNDVESIRVLQRVYGRSTGNFKALGWEVEMKVRDGKNDIQTFRLIVHDNVADNRIQTDLWVWT